MTANDRPDKEYVLQALLRYNYFPLQKNDKEELPPLFSSESLTIEIAKELNICDSKRNSNWCTGYDAVEYKITRFNGVVRSLSIPHPLPYSKLSLCIHNNWRYIEYILNNKNSVIHPQLHDDGRLIVMDYESSIKRSRNNLELQFGKRFLVRTDIANFYPSIYSHSIPWALVELEKAKCNRGSDIWFNKLDKYVRLNKRDETNGIAIGPATSNIMAEIILAKVDEALRNEGFSFIRFIDDYTAYCDTEEKALEFVRKLSQELSIYKHILNLKKTQIIPSPQPQSDAWVTQLKLLLPKKDLISTDVAINYLDLAVELSKTEPDGSVLKYAAKALLSQSLVDLQV